jgi:hypothetical protein
MAAYMRMKFPNQIMAAVPTGAATRYFDGSDVPVAEF